MQSLIVNGARASVKKTRAMPPESASLLGSAIGKVPDRSDRMRRVHRRQKCDAVMLWSLDGRQHLSQATAVLKAKKLLFIGRPLASDPADAVAIFKLAKELKVPCWSCSQHRYSPGFFGMRNHPEVGKGLGCDVYGGWEVRAADADTFTRSLHSIETLHTIMGAGCVKVSCTSTPKSESITAVSKDVARAWLRRN